MTKEEIIKALRDMARYPTVTLPRDSEALKVAADLLAQPEREPLEYWNAVEGWVKIDEVREHFNSVGCGTIYKTDGEGRAPLYTTPPQRTWVGLTQEELSEIYNRTEWDTVNGWEYERAIEAKLKEKNT